MGGGGWADSEDCTEPWARQMVSEPGGSTTGQPSFFWAGPGAWQGRAGQGVSRLYYTVKNTEQWLCGHEIFHKGSRQSAYRKQQTKERHKVVETRGAGGSQRWLARSRAHPGSLLHLQGLAPRRLVGNLGPLLPRAQGSLQPCWAASFPAAQSSGGHGTGELQIFLQGLDYGSFSLGSKNIPEGPVKPVG